MQLGPVLALGYLLVGPTRGSCRHRPSPVVGPVLVCGPVCMTAGTECTPWGRCVCGTGAEDAAGTQVVQVGQTDAGECCEKAGLGGPDLRARPQGTPRSHMIIVSVRGRRPRQSDPMRHLCASVPPRSLGSPIPGWIRFRRGRAGPYAALRCGCGSLCGPSAGLPESDRSSAGASRPPSCACRTPARGGWPGRRSFEHP